MLVYSLVACFLAVMPNNLVDDASSLFLLQRGNSFFLVGGLSVVSAGVRDFHHGTRDLLRSRDQNLEDITLLVFQKFKGQFGLTSDATNWWRERDRLKIRITLFTFNTYFLYFPFILFSFDAAFLSVLPFTALKSHSIQIFPLKDVQYVD